MLSSLGSGSIIVERFGSGPIDVVALHGWGRTAQDFVTVLDGFNAAAVQLPGFGSIEPPAEPWVPADYAEWLSAGLDATRPVILVGHSFGGRIAVRLAARHKELVKGVVLTGVPLTKLHPAKGPDWRYALLRTLRGIGLVSEKRLEMARRRYGSADYRSATGVMRDILVRTVGEDYLDDLSSLTVPIELVWGEFDRPAPLAVAHLAMEHIANGQLTVAKGSEHLLDATLVGLVREAIGRLMTNEGKS